MNLLDRILNKKPEVQQAKKVQQIIMDLFRQNMARYQHQLNEWQSARDERLDVDRPTTYLMQELYEDAMVDTHLTSAIESRILRQVNQNWVITGADGVKDDEKTKMINKPWFTDVVRMAMESLFYGYNLIFIKEVINGEITKVAVIPREHVIPEKGWIVKNTTDSDQGFPYEEVPNHLVYTQLGPNAIGLLEKACPMAILKRHSWGSWDEFEQRFGLPLMIAKVAGSSVKAKKEVASWMRSLGQGAGGVFNIGDELDVISGAQTDSYQVFLEKISTVNAELSKLINGQTMTADSGSSRSQGEVHEKTQNEITKADTREIMHWLNYVMKPVMVAHGYPLSDDETFDVFQKSDPLERIKIDIPLLQNGYKMTRKYIENTYKVELEEETEEQTEKPEPPKKDKPASPKQIKQVNDFFS